MLRGHALEELLKPIKWSLNSSVNARRNLVREKHNKVETVYPFLTSEERILADTWLKEESHSGLWD